MSDQTDPNLDLTITTYLSLDEIGEAEKKAAAVLWATFKMAGRRGCLSEDLVTSLTDTAARRFNLNRPHLNAALNACRQGVDLGV